MCIVCSMESAVGEGNCKTTICTRPSSILAARAPIAPTAPTHTLGRAHPHTRAPTAPAPTALAPAPTDGKSSHEVLYTSRDACGCLNKQGEYTVTTLPYPLYPHTCSARRR